VIIGECREFVYVLCKYFNERRKVLVIENERVWGDKSENVRGRSKPLPGVMAWRTSRCSMFV